VKEPNIFYVNALKDPRSRCALVVYIVKGAGTRGWEHEPRIDESAKGKRTGTRRVFDVVSSRKRASSTIRSCNIGIT
jgi:hypothetical protein